MSRFTDYKKSAMLSLLSGLIFVVVAVVQFASGGKRLLIVVNGGLGFLLLLDGGRRLWLSDRSAA